MLLGLPNRENPIKAPPQLGDRDPFNRNGTEDHWKPLILACDDTRRVGLKRIVSEVGRDSASYGSEEDGRELPQVGAYSALKVAQQERKTDGGRHVHSDEG